MSIESRDWVSPAVLTGLGIALGAAAYVKDAVDQTNQAACEIAALGEAMPKSRMTRRQDLQAFTDGCSELGIEVSKPLAAASLVATSETDQLSASLANDVIHFLHKNSEITWPE